MYTKVKRGKDDSNQKMHKTEKGPKRYRKNGHFGTSLKPLYDHRRRRLVIMPQTALGT